MLPILLVLVLLLYYGSALRCPKFRRWCRRYAADFTAIGAAITLRLGLRCPIFRCWCRRYAADFTAVGAAVTLRLGPTLPKFSPLV